MGGPQKMIAKSPLGLSLWAYSLWPVPEIRYQAAIENE